LLRFNQGAQLVRVAHGDGPAVVGHLLARCVVVAVDSDGFDAQALQGDQHLLAELTRAQQHDAHGRR